MSELVIVTRHEGVALVALNNPPVNALSHAVRVALLSSLEQLFADDGVAAIVIACKGRTFIAGADIREFGKPPLDPDLPELIEFIDTAPKPTIAAIHGSALGGGLELCLACHFRVATDTAKLGLPEVGLGILPGAGGTQRLPRLIGVKPALDMILSGAPISAAQARRLGLIDDVIAEPVEESAIAFARRVLSEGRARRRVSELSAAPDDAGSLLAYERDIERNARGFLAPFRCIEAVRAAVQLPFADGLRLERELFRLLIASPESKAQRHVFFGERDVAKVPELPDDTPTRPLKTVAIVGEGTIAAGLARCFADAKIPVTLVSDAQDRLEGTLAAVRGAYQAAVSRGVLSHAEYEARLGRIRPTLTDDDLGSADLLLEAVAENADAKRAALARLDAAAKPGAVLASTSSFLELEPLARGTRRPADVVGLYFGEPIEQSKLLQGLRAPRTAPDAYASVMKLGRSLGRVAVPVRGHVAGRLLATRLREALFLLEEGALPEQVDRALTDFGFATGPFAALDAVGFEGALAERRSRNTALTAREGACTLLEQLSDLGRSGAMTAPDPELSALLVRHSASRGIVRRSFSAEEIVARCLYSVINEAARVLDEGAAARPLDIDMIWVNGFGFPRCRGGPLFFADQLGLSQVHEAILRFHEQVGEEHWSPAPLLARLVAERGAFYAGAR